MNCHVSSRVLLFLGAAAALASGCEDAPSLREAQLGLRRTAGCDELSELLRAHALRQMELQLGANLGAALAAASSWGVQDDAAPTADASGSSPGAPGQSSGTNNQVEGVDEADFVKNRDGILFIANDGKLRIIAAWPAASMHVLSETPVEGVVKKLFIERNHAIVYSSPWAEAQPWAARECTYGYQCSFGGDGRPTKISVFDISNLAAPRLQRTVRLTGSLIAARMIDGTIHTVVSDWLGRSALPTQPEVIGQSALAITVAYGKLLEENRRLIAAAAPEVWLPSVEDSEQGQLAQCGSFWTDDLGDGQAITSVLSLAPSGSASFSSILSSPGAVYASQGSLYMAVPRARTQPGNNVWFAEAPAASEVSIVHRFSLHSQPAGADYRGSGLIKGRVLNQFAMDEYQGVLRIATTTGHAPSPDAHSTLSTLQLTDDGLQPLGEVDHIAPSEDIRSVRFAGKRGFVVTFKKTDPLYVFDLDPPQAPRILSELKIPGFSTYMHMLDDNHLLSIGYDADDQGSFAYFSGVLLQIFDVTDPTQPTLAHRQRIGTRGSSSEALTNHLSFTYFAPKQLLALPLTLCQGGGVGQAGNMTFSGLMLFHAAASDGFAERGRVTHAPGQDITCNNWWTDASSQVRRSVFMDDFVYSISGSTVKVNALANPAVDVAQVSIVH